MDKHKERWIVKVMKAVAVFGVFWLSVNVLVAVAFATYASDFSNELDGGLKTFIAYGFRALADYHATDHGWLLALVTYGVPCVLTWLTMKPSTDPALQGTSSAS